jgi:hypothetical protein
MDRNTSSDQSPASAISQVMAIASSVDGGGGSVDGRVEVVAA